MPRKNNRAKNCNQAKVIDLRSFQNVTLTKHVIDRSKSRRTDLKGLSDDKIRQKLVNEIKYSKVVGMYGSEEHRSYKGHIYVIKREKGELIAITYLLSNKRMTERKLNNRCIA